jgi:WhiB family redox-sensing transcriptional regulator
MTITDLLELKSDDLRTDTARVDAVPDRPPPFETGLPGTEGTDTDWEALAFCRTEPSATDVFFSEETADIVAAKRMCAACPVLAPCLEGALERAEPCGVWGGQLFSNGKIQTTKRRRGRPPKVARPEDQLPEVPIPDYLKPLVAEAS